MAKNNKIQVPSTCIPNEILEAFMKQKLSGQELRIVLVIIRKTYGFHKKEDFISLSQMSKYTGIHVKRCSLAVNRLEKANIITILEKREGKTKKYRFNERYEQWRSIPKKRDIPKKREEPSPKRGNIYPLKKGIQKKYIKENNIKEKEQKTEKNKYQDEYHWKGKIFYKDEISKLKKEKQKNNEFVKNVIVGCGSIEKADTPTKNKCIQKQKRNDEIDFEIKGYEEKLKKITVENKQNKNELLGIQDMHGQRR